MEGELDVDQFQGEPTQSSQRLFKKTGRVFSNQKVDPERTEDASVIRYQLLVSDLLLELLSTGLDNTILKKNVYISEDFQDQLALAKKNHLGINWNDQMVINEHQAVTSFIRDCNDKFTLLREWKNVRVYNIF